MSGLISVLPLPEKDVSAPGILSTRLPRNVFTLYMCVFAPAAVLPYSREGLEIDTIPFQAQSAPPVSPRSIHMACKALGRVDVLPGGSEGGPRTFRHFHQPGSQ